MANRLIDHFAEIEDPRDARGVRHLLAEMMVIALCAVICGAEDWKSVAAFGRAKQGFFAERLRLPHGIPSRYTFERVFAALRPEALERCLMAWTRALVQPGAGEQLAVDGKSLRGSAHRAAGKAAVHLINAWAVNNELVFGQLATEAKSNEITAIPKLLELLDLQGVTVTIDAEGCQKEIARTIHEGEGDYVLALKANQPTLHQEVNELLDDAIASGDKAIDLDFHQSTEGDHGRIETRRCWVTPQVGWFEDREQWAGLRSFAAVECERTVGDKTSCERRYFISSLPGTDAEALARAVRSHWGIENKLHWVLDVAFAEDDCRLRQGHGPENFSRLRRMALNLLRRETTAQLGIKNKRLLASWDHNYLLRLLSG